MKLNGASGSSLNLVDGAGVKPMFIHPVVPAEGDGLVKLAKAGIVVTPC